MRFNIVKQSDVSFGTALHYALDWTYGRKALCGKEMRSTARDGEVSYKRRCGSCVKIMGTLVEKAHAEALPTQVELDHAEALEVAKDRLDIADFDEEAVYAQAEQSAAHAEALEYAEIIAFEQASFDALIEHGGDAALAASDVHWVRDAAAVLACSVDANNEIARYYALVKKHGAAVPFRVTLEARKVDVDKVGAVHQGIPQAGDFILIGNAGGAHQSPGSYGYRRTEVLAVEREKGGLEMYRITTRAFGQGCWTSGHSTRLICGAR